jgi:hypothetical protein
MSSPLSTLPFHSTCTANILDYISYMGILKRSSATYKSADKQTKTKNLSWPMKRTQFVTPFPSIFLLSTLNKERIYQKRLRYSSWLFIQIPPKNMPSLRQCYNFNRMEQISSIVILSPFLHIISVLFLARYLSQKLSNRGLNVGNAFLDYANTGTLFCGWCTVITRMSGNSSPRRGDLAKNTNLNALR